MTRTWGRRIATVGTIGALALTMTGCSPPLDETFGGGDGIVTTRPSSTGWNTADAVAVQPDGKIVVYVGDGNFGSPVALVRLETDGTPDPTFGAGGTVLTDQQTAYGGCADLAVAPDGGYLMVVDTVDGDGDSRSSIVRYHADGTRDEAFGDDGVAVVPGDGLACGLDVQPDGRIVAGGSSGEGALTARWTPDGQPDPSYGGDGVGEPFPGPNVFRVYGTVEADVQPDGGIVAVGTAMYLHTGDVYGTVLRYRPDGTLDPAFGQDGWVLTSAATGGLDGVATRPDGRVVVFGNQLPMSHADPRGFLVAQITADGTLDPTFGPAGTGVATAVDGGTARDMALLDDGDVVVVGGTAPGGIHDGFLLARFTPEGDLDDGFADHGVGTTDAYPTDEAAYAIVAQPDGKLVVAGSVGDDNPATFGSLAGVYRYDAGG